MLQNESTICVLSVFSYFDLLNFVTLLWMTVQLWQRCAPRTKKLLEPPINRLLCDIMSISLFHDIDSFWKDIPLWAIILQASVMLLSSSANKNILAFGRNIGIRSMHKQYSLRRKPARVSGLLGSCVFTSPHRKWTITQNSFFCG